MMLDQDTCREESEKTARILIVDDHALIRRGLEQLINEQPGLKVCGEATDEEEAIRAVADKQPDLAIIDLSLGENSGIDLIGKLRSSKPDLPMLVLSMHDETFYAEQALRAGARGYVMKGGSLHHLIGAIDQVLQGKVFLSDKMKSRLAERLTAQSPYHAGTVPERLSAREFRVFELIGDGFGPSEIAQELHLSVKTIETYRSHIKEKLELESAAALRQFAIQWKKKKL